MLVTNKYLFCIMGVGEYHKCGEIHRDIHQEFSRMLTENLQKLKKC